MRIRSFWFCEWMTEDEVQTHECSDRIFVPRRMFERWLTEEEAGSVVIVQLDTIAACMYAPHNGPNDLIYAPSWMCYALHTKQEAESDDDDDYIIPIRYKPSMCTFLKLQPHTSTHLENQMDSPEDVLSRGFEQYTCLSEGQTLSIRLESGETMDVTVMEAHPQSEEKSPLCIRNTEINLELLPPLDMPIPEASVSIPEPEPVPVQPVTVPTYFQGEGHVVSEETEVKKPLTREERRELMAKAALERANKIQHENS